VLDDKPNVATPTAELTHRVLDSAADGRCRTADLSGCAGTRRWPPWSVQMPPRWHPV